MSMAYFQALNISLRDYMSKELSRTSLGDVLQGLNVTSSELVNGAKKECENPLTTLTHGHK